jgi:hypothetical protein
MKKGTHSAFPKESAAHILVNQASPIAKDHGNQWAIEQRRRLLPAYRTQQWGTEAGPAQPIVLDD